MMYTIAFFTWRYVRGASAKNSLSKMIKICFLAITLGTFCLTLVAAIMNGFKEATYTTLQNIHADFIMEVDSEEHLNVPAIEKVLQKEFPSVISCAPRASSHVILEKNFSNHAQQNIVTLQALQAAQEIQTTNLLKTVRVPKHGHFEQLLHGCNIFIGSKLAHDLAIHTGESVTLHYFPDHEELSHNNIFQTQKVTVAGIFSTGIADYDSSVIWCSFHLFHELFPHEGVTSLGLRICPHANHKQLLQDLNTRFNVNVSPWYELYPALLQALQLEQYAMFIILFFIVMLASLTLASTLMLHIEHKRVDIALLRAMGMPTHLVKKIFMAIGVSIAGIATLCGMLSGWCASWLINTYKLITLPDAYYISYLPAYIAPSYFFMLFLVACIISLTVIWYAAGNSKSFSISSILRS